MNDKKLIFFTIDDEKQVLIAILTSLDIKVENKDEILCLIDMGFSAVQVSEAIKKILNLSQIQGLYE